MLKTRFLDETSSKRITTARTNFSTSVSAQQKAKVLSEAKPLLDAHLKCKELWETLQVADFKKDGNLNDAALTILVDRQSKNLSDLLLVHNVEELLDVLDEDEDGFINEDEQILMFSIIKERMQLIADELMNIHEYGLYRDMMKSVRLLEADILNYQNILRQRTHQKELSIYQEIGIQKEEEFAQDWDRIFRDFEIKCQKNMEALKQQHTQEMEELNIRMQKDVEFVKVKPKSILRELQTREKLVAINERYAEAHQIRTELETLEIEEQNRVENKILSEQDKKRKKLLKEQEKEVQFALMKNTAALNKLKIKMQNAKTRLDKEIRLHIHDITKNQNLSSRLALKVGETRDELRRIKNKSRKMQEFLKENKRALSRRRSLEVHTAPAFHPSQSTVSRTTLNRMSPSKMGSMVSVKSESVLKHTLRNITKFNIKSDVAGSERPVNVIPEFMSSTSLASKTRKLLKQSKKEKDSLPALTILYNDKLERIINE
ncbi:unnamed protein product [Blepharisma stoltei]|uniref:EF-hand domain-containing protein n=1 Tax=Blepharisma stoltei TaxID=1481888 RepID=A0AAU9K7R7_9CILI|nr:unnamed protein product [Blepharisma stoltei]